MEFKNLKFKDVFIELSDNGYLYLYSFVDEKLNLVTFLFPKETKTLKDFLNKDLMIIEISLDYFIKDENGCLGIFNKKSKKVEFIFSKKEKEIFIKFLDKNFTL